MSVALITGASMGFGRAVASALAADGWDLVVDARRPGPLAEAAQSLEESGVRVVPLAGDVADPGHRRQLVESAGALGALDLLVNNAGALGPSPLPAVRAVSDDDLRSLIEVNVVAPLALVRLALPLLRASGGTVVAVTSDAAVEAYEGWGAYGASKAALEQLHHVLGAEEPALRVIRFDPGDMRTEMHQAAFPGEDISDRPGPEVAAAALRRLLASPVPSGRYGAGDVDSLLAEVVA